MQTVKILHCADFHLGSGFGGLDRQTGHVQRVELRQAFSRMLALCRKEQVQLLLIAGDFFDHVQVPRELVREVAAELGGLDIPVAVTTGNHDPLTPDSPWQEQNVWPANVTILPNDGSPVELAGLGVRLYGAGFDGVYQKQTRLPRLDAPQDEWIDICVAHGTLVPSGQQTPYHPIHTEDIRQSGMDYIALGHVHACSGVQREGTTSYAYPGCPVGRGFDEEGTKGVLLGEVGKSVCKLDFHPLAQRCYFTQKVDVSGVVTTRACAERIHETLQHMHGDDYKNHLYKIILTGELDGDVRIDWAALSAAMDGVYAKFTDKTTLAVDVDTLAQTTTLRGVFVRRMQEQAGSKERVAQALKLGLQALEAKVDYHAD